MNDTLPVAVAGVSDAVSVTTSAVVGAAGLDATVMLVAIGAPVMVNGTAADVEPLTTVVSVGSAGGLNSEHRSAHSTHQMGGAVRRARRESRQGMVKIRAS